MEQWKEYTLGEIAKFSQGIQVDIENQSLSPKEGYVRFIRIVDFTKGNEPIRYIAKPKEQYLTRKDDIVMIRYGSQTAGLVVKSFSGAIANNMFKISLDEDIINKKFAYYVLSQKSIFSSIRNSQSSSTMPAITFEIASKIHLYLPNLDEQKRIADFLSSLDDKIELNRQINDNLEQQAQALFKSWFVDFEPFKDGEFVDSELGMIPKGWRVGSLNEFCSNIERGNIPKYVDKSNSPILNQKVNKGLYLDTQYYKFNDDNAIVPDSKLAQKGDVLVNSLGQGTLGRIHLYKETKNNVIVDQFITILRTTSFVKSIYLYLLLNTDIYQNVIESNITGSTGMWVLTINNIRRIKIVQPHDCEFEKIESYFSSIYNSISANNAEIERLSTLRDTLLPRLMSGELKINEINC